MNVKFYTKQIDALKVENTELISMLCNFVDPDARVSSGTYEKARVLLDRLAPGWLDRH